MTSSVARQLVHLRQRAGLSQRDLARRAGVPASVLCAYERGAREPSASAFQRIVRAAGGTVEVSVPSAQERRERDAALQDVLDLAESLPQGAPAPPPRLRLGAG